MSARPAKFMANILSESKHRTRYVKALKDITPDAQVSYQRIMVGLGVLTLIVVTAVWLITRDAQKIGYVVWPLLFITIGCVVLTVLYIINSRDKSMLASVMDYILFQAGERTRRKATKFRRARTIGISEVDSTPTDTGSYGLIRFRNGDVGVMYDVEGQLSLSVLPAVVDTVAAYRHQYYVARPVTTTEHLFTAVKQADVESKLEYLGGVYEHARDTGDAFSATMANYLYNYVDLRLSKQTQIFQSIIVRDIDEDSLIKARQQFESKAGQGMYAEVTLLNRVDIVRRLRPLTMLSDKGASALTGLDESNVSTYVDDVDELMRSLTDTDNDADGDDATDLADDVASVESRPRETVV